MAAKKPVKKAAKPAPKPAGKAPVKSTVAKKVASKAAPAKKSLPVKKAAPAAKKVVAKKAAPAKKVPVKKAPPPAKKPAAAQKPVAAKKPAAVKKAAPVAKATVASKAAPIKQAPTTPATPAPKTATPAAAKPTPSKSGKSGRSGKAAKLAEPKPVVISSAQIAPRTTGKVAVAVIARPSAPAPKGKFKSVPFRTDESTGRPIVPNGYKPGADEEYMSVLQLEYFRQSLLDWRADLVEESKQTIENLKEEVRDVGDEAERATRETENSLELRTRDRYRKLIGKIDSTLKRMDNGDYGYCVDTGEEIGLDRLEARLTAERTIDAQERWEHMQKQMGD